MGRAVLMVDAADYAHIEQRLRALALLESVELVAIRSEPPPALDRLRFEIPELKRPEPHQPYYRRFERKRRPR